MSSNNDFAGTQTPGTPYIIKVKEYLRGLIEGAVKNAVSLGKLPEGEIPKYVVEIPSNRDHGDLSVNIAMVGARAFKTSPRNVAQAITDCLSLEDTVFERVDIAGPGFINFFFKQAFYSNVLKDVLNSGDKFGYSDYGKGKKVMVEFVSANPTGPMHMGNARGGALGDCLASVFEYAGFDVWREFYVNNAGSQIEKFALSLEVRYIQHFKGAEFIELPEDAYHGDDIRQHAEAFAEIHQDKYLEASQEERRKALVDYALPLNITRMKKDLAAYRVEYDRWFMESDLHESGEVSNVVQLLKDKGLTYEKDGATWYKASENGGEKDEVLIRNNGHPTYFAADIAYHHNKFNRGFDQLINAWGADHHGHVARMKGVLDATGYKGDSLEIVLYQMVNLMKNGEKVRMSKRTGKTIQLIDLLDEVPVDAARFFFNYIEPNTTMDFDLGLAVEQSSTNPVYYAEYAHARICSIIRRLSEKGVNTASPASSEESFKLLTTGEERELLYFISTLPEEIIDGVKNYNPTRLTRYCVELATLFHKFYDKCRVDIEDEALRDARVALCVACRQTLKNTLTLLKIEAPVSM